MNIVLRMFDRRECMKLIDDADIFDMLCDISKRNAISEFAEFVDIYGYDKIKSIIKLGIDYYEKKFLLEDNSEIVERLLYWLDR